MDAFHPNYGLSKSKEEAFAEEDFTDLLPRAVIRPNTFILLDGEWRFELDTEDRGLQESWYIQHEFKYTANWPGSIEDHMSASK